MNRPDLYARGSVWRVRLDPVEGSEQGGTRPVVIISSDLLNAPLPVVTVAVITTRKTERARAAMCLFPTAHPTALLHVTIPLSRRDTPAPLYADWT